MNECIHLEYFHFSESKKLDFQLDEIDVTLRFPFGGIPGTPFGLPVLVISSKDITIRQYALKNFLKTWSPEEIKEAYLFIDRHNLRSNIIIDGGNARPAKNIQELREVLGIKASDNLMNANYVLVVEGEEDVIALKSLLSHLSEKLSKAIKNNSFIIDKIGGAGNLSYKLSLLKNTLCVYHVLLDNDHAGQTAYNKAQADDNLRIKDVTFVNCQGMVESEFEDCLEKDAYKAQILSEYGVNLDVTAFRGNSKWSDRIKRAFLSQGKPWNDNVEKSVKQVVASTIAKRPVNSLNQHKRSSIDALVRTLESMIAKTK